MKHALIPVLSLPLVACSSTPSAEDVLRSHGYSETYVNGYHAGCESGKHAAGEVFAKRSQDNSAYALGGDYKVGWDYGFVTCKRREIEEIEAALAAGIAAGVAGSVAHGADGVDARKALEGMDTSAIQAAGW